MEKQFVRGRLFRLGAVALTGAVLFGLVGISRLSAARSSATVNITIVNNSSKDIRHLYLAAGDPNNWSGDQLGGSWISSGSSYTLSNVSCQGSTIRVIPEDQDGCFRYQTVTCAGDSTWTITNDTPRDCG
jgi:hypothetical protein